MSDTNIFVPDVTVNLTDADVLRLKEAVELAAEMFGEGQPTTVAVDAVNSLTAGENRLRTVQAVQLEKAITVKDAEGNPFALLLGLPAEQQSSTFKAIQGPLDEVRGKVELMIGEDQGLADKAQSQFNEQFELLAPAGDTVGPEPTQEVTV